MEPEKIMIFNTLCKPRTCLACLILPLSILVFGTPNAKAGEERHVNLLALQAKQATANFDSIITGNLGQVITSMENKSHVLFATHTANIKDRDVINLQSDVLRLTSKNVLANGGFNCRFIFDDESDEDSAFYSISGICDQLVANRQGTKKKQSLIKRTMLSDPSTTFNVWTRIFADEETGVVFYADID